MKHHITTLLALALLATSCGNITLHRDIQEDSTATDIPATPAGEPSLRELTRFSTHHHTNEDGQVDELTLNIFVDTNKQTFQLELPWPKDEDLLGSCGETDEPDINFDGNPDLLVTLGDYGVNPGLLPTVFYAAFIWNEATGQFEQVHELDQVANLTIDPKRKLIISDYTTAVGDEYHEEYAWKDGQLEKVKEAHTNPYDEEDEAEEEKDTEEEAYTPIKRTLTDFSNNQPTDPIYQN